MPTISELAGQMYDQFEQAKRDNGDEFYRLKDGHPDWMTDVIREAHSGMLPDDWKYAMIHDALSSIHDYADEDATADDLREQISEWADSDTDSYNAQLSAWLASDLRRGAYVDDAISDFGWSDDRGIFGALAIGQMREREEIYQSLIDSLAERADSLADEAVEP
jgi:hypothetical protein